MADNPVKKTLVVLMKESKYIYLQKTVIW
jgi:hypothetical protein